MKTVVIAKYVSNSSEMRSGNFSREHGYSEWITQDGERVCFYDSVVNSHLVQVGTILSAVFDSRGFGTRIVIRFDRETTIIKVMRKGVRYLITGAPDGYRVRHADRELGIYPSYMLAMKGAGSGVL